MKLLGTMDSRDETLDPCTLKARTFPLAVHSHWQVYQTRTFPLANTDWKIVSEHQIIFGAQVEGIAVWIPVVPLVSVATPPHARLKQSRDVEKNIRQNIAR